MSVTFINWLCFLCFGHLFQLYIQYDEQFWYLWWNLSWSSVFIKIKEQRHSLTDFCFQIKLWHAWHLNSNFKKSKPLKRHRKYAYKQCMFLCSHIKLKIVFFMIYGFELFFKLKHTASLQHPNSFSYIFLFQIQRFKASIDRFADSVFLSFPF